MYMVRYNKSANNLSQPMVVYKVFNSLEKAIAFSKTVDLIEIKEIPA